MKVSYFPGCSLHGTAREYEESVEAVCQTLGVELKELDDWNCCGASSAHMVSDKLALSLSARNLELAASAGRDLLVPCAACYQRLKTADKELRAGPQTGESTYEGNFRIRHLVDFLWEDVGSKAIDARVKRPLDKLNPVCYYGCLTVRPPKITDAPHPEDPQAMDNIMQGLGAKVRDWSYKTDCCGGSLVLTRPDIVRKLVQKLMDAAIEAGADSIVTGCPMCFGNLDNTQQRISQETGKLYRLPIFYISEMAGLAFGSPAAGKWFRRHIIDPQPLLAEKGLI